MQAADNLAYTIASRFCRQNVVTARLQELNFLAPVKTGDVVLMEGQVIRVGRTSMDVEIKIEGEDLKSGRRFAVAAASFTMVAVDGDGRPVPVQASGE